MTQAGQFARKMIRSPAERLDDRSAIDLVQWLIDHRATIAVTDHARNVIAVYLRAGNASASVHLHRKDFERLLLPSLQIERVLAMVDSMDELLNTPAPEKERS